MTLVEDIFSSATLLENLNFFEPEKWLCRGRTYSLDAPVRRRLMPSVALTLPGNPAGAGGTCSRNRR